MPDSGRLPRNWDTVHTCHAKCPCHTGGEPVADFDPTFASYCPHCYTGDPGEDYCGSCGEAL